MFLLFECLFKKLKVLMWLMQFKLTSGVFLSLNNVSIKIKTLIWDEPACASGPLGLFSIYNLIYGPKGLNSSLQSFKLCQSHNLSLSLSAWTWTDHCKSETRLVETSFEDCCKHCQPDKIIQIDILKSRHQNEVKKQRHQNNINFTNSWCISWLDINKQLFIVPRQ
jgi:hypothetical protein